MTPERTNYLTNGVDGIKRLAQGPELSSYRGLQIIPTRKFSMDAGTAPRDLLKRRVRVAEYYRIPYHKDNVNKLYEFYDQSRDTMFKLTYEQLVEMADLGTSDSGSDGSGKYKHGKRGVTVVHKNGWDPDSIADSTVIEPEHARDKDGLELHSLILNDGSRDKKKFRKADVTGANISIASCNIPIKDAVQSIENGNYHVASETFGGGLFNDPIQKGNLLKCNFEAINSAESSIADTFIPYMMTSGMNYLKMQNGNAYFSEISGLEKSIESGEGKCTTPDSIIKLMYHRSVQRGLLNNVDTISPDRILDTSSDDIRTQLNKNPVNLNNFKNLFGALENDLKTFFSVSDVKRLYKNKTLEQVCDEFMQTRQHVLVQEKNDAEIMLMNVFAGSHADTYTIITEPAAMATIQYNEFLRNWSSDIVLENAIVSFITPDVVRPYVARPHMQAHSNFIQLRTMIQADLIKKHCNYLIDDSFTIRTQANKTDQKCINVLESFKNGNDQLKRFYTQFLHDIHTHSEIGVIASNVANSGVFQQAFRPNLHISRCQPLNASDVDNSPSSMNENTWLIQHLASMIPLTKEICDTLTSQSGLASGDALLKEYKTFLTGNETHHVKDPYDSLLMHWLMSKIHPKAETREKAKKHCRISENDEQYLVDAIGNLLRNNTTFDDNIETVFSNLCQGSFVNNHGKSFYCPGLAAVHYPNIPTRLSNDDKHYNELSKRVDWMNMPIMDKTFDKPEEDNGHYYNALSGSVESTANTESTSVKLPWIFNLSKYLNANMLSESLVMSALSHHCFPMSFETGDMDGHNHKQNICDGDLEYLIPGNIAMCTSQPDVVILNLLLVLANRFWKPTSRAMMNGVGIPIASSVNDASIIKAATLRTENRLSSSNTGIRTWVVEGTGCHLMHGPTLPSVGGGGGVGGVGAHDIVILRPNIEHEMLGIIMGRGGTQELGATFWYVLDKINARAVSCLCCAIY